MLTVLAIIVVILTIAMIWSLRVTTIVIQHFTDLLNESLCSYEDLINHLEDFYRSYCEQVVKNLHNCDLNNHTIEEEDDATAF